MSLETLCVKIEVEEVCVKAEAEECDNEKSGAHIKEEGQCELYEDHKIKDELVLGPEELHRPCVPLTHPVSVKRAEALGRACSVRLERLLVDAARRSCRVGRHTYTLRRTSETSDCTDTSSATYQCDECCRAFRSKSVLRKHMNIHWPGFLRNSTQKTIAYNPCSSKFTTKLLKSHIVKNLFHCNHCSYATKDKGSLRRHLNVHTAEKPYKCSHCDYKCSQKPYLQRHLKIHSGEKPFQCSICDFKCNTKNYLQAHEKIHAGIKPFKCGHCDYTCSHKPHLKVHERKHTGEKPFACNICEHRSIRKGDLIIHQRTHTGERPFQCTNCDFKTGHKPHLRAHEMIHSGEKPFKCEDCEYRCRRKSHLRSHQMVHSRDKLRLQM